MAITVSELLYRALIKDEATPALQSIDREFDNVVKASQQTDTAISKASSTFERFARRNDDVAKSARALAQAQTQLYAAQEAGTKAVAAGDTTQAALDRTIAGMTKTVRAHAAALDTARGKTTDVGTETKLAAHQVQNLVYQLQDAAVQLAGGQNPFLIMMQQGPQATGAVGGVSNAWRLVSAALTPARLAIGGVAAALAVSVTAAASADAAITGLRNKLVLTRGDYASLATQIDDVAHKMSASSSISTNDARSAGAIIAGQSGFSGSADDLEHMIDVAKRLAEVLGTDVPEQAKKLALAIKSPGSAAKQAADDGLKTLNQSLARQIELMELSGNKAAATTLVVQAYRDATKDVAKTDLDEAVERLSIAFTKLWQDIRPGVVLLGSVIVAAFTGVINAIAWVIEKVEAVAGAVSTAIGQIVDAAKKASGIDVSAAASTSSANVNPAGRSKRLDDALGSLSGSSRFDQRASIQARLSGLRAGLSDASDPTDIARLNSEIAAQGAALAGTAGPMAEYLRGLREQATISKAAEGAAREFASAEIAANAAARAASGGVASAAEKAEAYRLVQEKLDNQLRDTIVGMARQADVNRAYAVALPLGAAAAQEAADNQTAFNEAMAYGTIGSQKFLVALALLQGGYKNLRASQQESREQTTLSDQRDQIEVLRLQKDMYLSSADAINEEVAALQERQKIVREGGDSSSASSIERIANARTVATLTSDVQRLNGYTNQAGEAFSTAFEDAIFSGNSLTDVLGSLDKALAQIVIRMTLLEPLAKSIGSSLGGGGGIFGSLFGSGFSTGPSLGPETTNSAGAMTVAQLLSTPFANGGIMTDRGSLPLNRYANGGVANSPQLAMFGEGKTPEAYVPLPDGRSIPVNMRGGGGGGLMISQPIQIDARGASNGVATQLAAMASGIQKQTKAELMADINRGGSTAKTVGRRRR